MITKIRTRFLKILGTESPNFGVIYIYIYKLTNNRIRKNNQEIRHLNWLNADK